MNRMTAELRKRVQEIKDFAKGNSISYNTMIDILEEKNRPVSEEEIAQIISELAVDGITIDPSDDYDDGDAVSDEPEKFVPANVHIEQRTLSIWNVMERLRHNEFDLQPGFQRQKDLWTKEQQSRLIESLMLKIPLPAFYFDAASDEKWKVIDGLQRLSAIRRFLLDSIDDESGTHEQKQEKFSGLQYLKEFNGLTFNQLPRQYIRRVQESNIIAYTVEKGTPDAVIFNIFQRINTGGLQLEAQEIRHALYQGKATKLTEELAKSDEFLKATGGAVSSDRMLDLEYVTRFIAFTELDYQEAYKGDINAFLNRALKTVNAYSEEGLQRISINFKIIMNESASLFQKYAFRRYNAEGRRGPINKAMFELWVICLNGMPQDKVDCLIANRSQFIEEFKSLQQLPEFISAIRSNDTYSVNKRVTLTKNMLEKMLCYNR